MDNKGKYRIETDSIGEIQVPSDKYWGAQTQRSLKYFQIGRDRLPDILIEALAIVKKCAAQANRDVQNLPKEKADIIVEVADDIIAGKFLDNFLLSVWQTGSCTQSNMNINEVISNIAIERLGGVLGSKTPIHPNDDVNKGQSTNDVFPTAMHIAVVLSTQRNLLPAIQKITDVLKAHVANFKDIIKIGRTHMQDATPITLAQEFSAYVSQMEKDYSYLEYTMNNLYSLAQGGTAVGTGISSKKGFDEKFAEHTSHHTKLPFKSAKNKFAAIASHDELLLFSGALNVLATSLNKIANDIKFLACGPRSGIAEITIPANEPGSSIMPGKVNPTQAEAVTMVCCQVIGQHLSTTLGSMYGHLELNVHKPVIALGILDSIHLLSDAINSFTDHCLVGIKPNHKRINELLDNSLMLSTALNKHIGYDNAAKIAKYAYEHDITLKEAAITLNLVTSEDFDTWVNPKDMIHPSS